MPGDSQGRSPQRWPGPQGGQIWAGQKSLAPEEMIRMAKELWVGKVLGRKPGALHRQLGIPLKQKIPTTLLRTIIQADTGDVVKNPTKAGKRRYRVTTLMQRRVNPVLTVRGFKHRRRWRRIIH